MSPENKKKLEDLALKVREHIVNLSTDGGCFIGASLSCADLLVYLYSDYLKISPETVNSPERDYLFLSKGHDVPALYGTLAELGYIERDRLKNHLKTNDSIYWHPNRNIPGIEFHSGSLGHLPAVAFGVAMDIQMRGGNNKVVCIIGDGECDEGSVWETMLVASAYKMDNLVFLIDRNKFQANIATEDLIPLEPMAPKFEAFGCAVHRFDGHDFNAIEGAFANLPLQAGKPSVLIADTVRGKGLPSIEARADRWFVNFNRDEISGLMGELHGKDSANLTSETLVVR